MSGAPPKVLLFDLGGVVVDFRGPERLHALTRGAHDVSALRAKWGLLPELDGLERGTVSPEIFADAFMAEWAIDGPRTAFLHNFKHWVVGVIDDAPELIAPLGADYRLACLSNLNPLHWARCVELGVGELFAEKFLSFEMGLRKPEAAIYAAVVAALGVTPGDILFFDDVEVNVAAARAAGMNAVLVDSVIDGECGLAKALGAISSGGR